MSIAKKSIFAHEKDGEQHFSNGQNFCPGQKNFCLGQNVFVLDKFDFVLDKNYFVRAEGRGISMFTRGWKIPVTTPKNHGKCFFHGFQLQKRGKR